AAGLDPQAHEAHKPAQIPEKDRPEQRVHNLTPVQEGALRAHRAEPDTMAIPVGLVVIYPLV
ncbi:MAG: hypothetical protein AAF829_07705, partial [Pseudomonadota bacterium]